MPEASFEFVVVSDTHYMHVSPGERVEFSSRLRQSARAEVARRLISELEVPLIIHLGDLVQEFPGSEHFDASKAFAKGLWTFPHTGVRWVAGNHDVGDKPDPTLVGLDIRRSWLDAYHEEFGRSWYSFDAGGAHFVVLNGQLFNSGFPEEGEQMGWLRADFEAHGGRRTFVITHMPPYLHDPDEPGTGHYDNIAQPARQVLLELMERHQVEWLLSGHVHFSFYDRRGPTRFLTVTSPAFTRPGFPHVFRSSAPPERGRDDVGKLGFYLFRFTAAGVERHLVRTSGATEVREETCTVLTRTTVSLPDARVGVSLLHPLASAALVPLAWPSAVRQPVRNDYPLLACLEAGIRCVRAPLYDLEDAFQAGRLAVLQEEGTEITATAIWESAAHFEERVERHLGRVSAWELNVPGGWPSKECLDAVARCKETHGVAIALSPIVTGAQVEGKQHPRTRRVYALHELEALEKLLDEADVSIDRVVCEWDPGALQDGDVLSTGRIGAVDFALQFAGEDDEENADRIAEALFALYLDPKMARSRLYVEPWVDLDRTMDTAHGLLDLVCNPRPAFHVLRMLQSVLQGSPLLKAPCRFLGRDKGGVWSARNEEAHVVLMPSSATAETLHAALPPDFPDESRVVTYHLSSGTRSEARAGEFCRQQSPDAGKKPRLVLAVK